MSMKTELSLKGKVAIITGAGNGIGATVARVFTELGAAVSLLDINSECLAIVGKECEQINGGQPKPLLAVGSVTDSEVLKKYVADTIKTFGKLDILINNAGVTKLTTLIDSPLEDFDNIFNVNVRAIIELTKIATPHLIKSQGSVVSMSSVAGGRVVDGRFFYGMSKAAVKIFTQYAANELGKYNVRVNCISPGAVKTDIFLNYGITKSELPKYFNESAQHIASGRCAEPKEIVQLIAFLASDLASYITGADYVIDGGLLVKPAILAKVNDTD